MRSSPGSVTTSCWYPQPADLEPARVGRDGTLALALERRGGGSAPGRCRDARPLPVLGPLGLDGPPPGVSVVHPTGGLGGRGRAALDGPPRAGPRARAS